eukprot:g23403.t1
MITAKSKLANAMKAATLAGVSEATLLEVSAQEEEAQEKPQVAEGELKNGSRVEIHGLESETGKQLNGQVGTITSFLEEKGRYQIALADKVVSIRPENLQLRQATGDGAGTESTFQVGDRVEVNGLESEAGRTREVVSVRPANMTYVEKASESSSSSSGSEEKKPKKRKRSSANPEEALEAMLKGEKVKTDKKKKSARDAGAAAAWAAQANEAETGPLRPGDIVEIHGLQSVSGQAHCSRNKLFRFSSVSFSPEALNGKSGLITKWDEVKGRFQVELGMANLQSLKPENLKRTAAQPQRPHSEGCGEFADSYSGSTAGYTLL